ncbi:MAG: nitrate/nitrite transporter NrtS [Mariprofundaceae bacterium]
MKERLLIACHPDTIKVAFRTALIVGPLLVLINYGDTFMAQEVSSGDWIKIALTMLVPYLVSTASCVGIVHRSRRGGSGS